MPKAAFRQAEIERIIKAATNSGAEVQIDLKTLTMRVLPLATAVPVLDAPEKEPPTLRLGKSAPHEEENWDD